jgi:hypothetical protein
MTRFRRATSRVGAVLGRSFFPFAALTVILGTLLWGPWVSLLIALGLWELAGLVA